MYNEIGIFSIHLIARTHNRNTLASDTGRYYNTVKLLQTQNQMGFHRPRRRGVMSP